MQKILIVEDDKEAIADFLQDYTILAQNPDFQKAYERGAGDIARNDMDAKLTEEEKDFLGITLEATGREFIAKYQSDPEPSVFRQQVKKQRDEMIGGRPITVFDFSADFGIAYSVPDDIQKFIDSRTEDELVAGQAALDRELERLGHRYSGGGIQLDIDLISYFACGQREDARSLR